MSIEQIFCLFGMFSVGVLTVPLAVFWKEMSKNAKIFFIVWMVFWVTPPLYFLWAKGVMG